MRGVVDRVADADELGGAGFAVGRSIFGAAAREWMQNNINDAAVIDDVANRYLRLIDLWRGMRA